MNLRDIFGAALGTLCLDFAVAAGARPTPELLAALKSGGYIGGYIVYVLHGSIGRCERPNEEALLRSGGFRLDECATQRNLTDEGRAKVQEAGAVFWSLNMAVGEILASRFCRTLETARLFFAEEPTPADDLKPDAVTVEPGRAEALRAWFQEPPAAGTNAVVVAGGMMAALDGTQPDDGEALVYQSGIGPEFQRLVEKTKVREWVVLAARRP